MMRLQLILFAELLLHCTSTESVLHRMVSVGLFSACDNKTNRTPFNEMASYYRDVYTKLPDLVAQRLTDVSNRTNFVIGVDFVSFDVCNDTDLLVKHLLTVLLRKDFFHDEDNQRRSMRVFLLHAFIPPFMSRLIQRIASFESFIKLCAPISCDRRFLVQRSLDYSQYLKQLLLRLQWKDVTLILINQNGVRFPWIHYFEEAYKVLLGTRQFCLKQRVFEVPFKNFTRHMAFEVLPVLREMATNSSALIFFNSEIVNPYIIWQMKRIPISTSFILHEFAREIETENTNWLAITNVQRSRLDTYLRTSSSQLAAGGGFATFDEFSVLQHALSFGMYSRLVLGKRALNEVIQFAYSLLEGDRQQQSTVVPISGLLRRKQSFKTWFREPELASEIFLNSTPIIPLGYKIPRCSPGYHFQYGIINNNNNNNNNTSPNLFDQQHGTVCEKCPVNYVQFHAQNITQYCRPCHGTFRYDNGNRTQCIDPFRDQFITLTHRKYWIVIVTSSFGAVTCLLFLVIFILNRNTPIVKVSDFNISLMHLVILFMTIVTCYSVYTVAPLTLQFLGISFLSICVSRNLLLTMFYTANVTFVFIKSQKVLDAFLTTLRLRVGQRRRTMGVQLFTVILFLIVANALWLVLRMRDGAPQVKQQLDLDHKIRTNLCSTTQHRNTIMWNMNVFQLACLIQAFRGRNLPGPMNNAMTLVYTTMATTISFAVCTVLSLFQQGAEMMFIECTAIISNCIISVMVLYGKQCFIIIFKPHKNTRQYFSQKRMLKMRRKVGMID